MTDIVGIQARIAWELLLSGDGCLHDSGLEADYNGLLEGMEAAQLLSLMEKVLERLKQLGAEPVASGERLKGQGDKDGGTTVGREPETLYIDSSYHIRLGSPDGPAIPFRPLVRALFILFLRHPEGLVFKHMLVCRRALLRIYSAITRRENPAAVVASIDRLLDSTNNSINEKCSRIKAAFLARFADEIAENYYITNQDAYTTDVVPNEIYNRLWYKGISLDRKLVTFESEI